MIYRMLLLSLVILASTPAAQFVNADSERASVRAKSNEILTRLYGAEPSAKGIIESAAGYAVFSNFGMKIMLAGGGKGQGVAIDNKTRAETFMKMVEVQAGLGLGVKSFNLVWVFQSQSAFDQFVNSGWEIGGQASAAAQLDDKGDAIQGAVSVSPGVWLYQLTEDGLALELTVKGTKYYKDDDLN
jgi:lipid-binding SYLF domain-containing protein